MHHPSSRSAAWRLRFASLLLVGNRLLIITAIGLLLTSLFASDGQLMIFGSIFVGLSLLLLIVQRIAASHAGCPLCRTPVLAPMGCATHRNARPMLGSYQLRVALAIMLTEQFRCPYCNEPTAMSLRQPLPRGQTGT